MAEIGVTYRDRADFDAVWERSLPARVRLLEVGPRDGLQNIDRFVPTATKIALVNRLVDLGVERIEAVAFVSPKAVPQMRDAAEVMAAVDRSRATRFVGLVPNPKGTQRAIEAGVDELNFVIAASEAFNQANLRRSIETSLGDLAASARLADAAGRPLRLTISTAFGCPFEGRVDPRAVIAIARRGLDLGCMEICLGDTTGMANPRQVFRLFRRLRSELPEAEPAVHLHNTRGSGAANLLAALQAGVDIFDASIGGLGGCPFAPGASGNVATEDMLHMLDGMGVSAGIDVGRYIETAREAETLLDLRLPGQVIRAGAAFAL